MFPNRIDKTILRAIYTEDDLSVKQICAPEKYQIKLAQLSPFVDESIVEHKVAVQREKYDQEIKEYLRKEKYFKQVYKEVHEDTTTSEDEEEAFK